MKILYSILNTIFAFVLFTSPLAAQVGTRWDQQIIKPNRFKAVNDFNDAAVLDKETGLLWEQSPSTDPFNWFEALVHCWNKVVGGRKGWRLPTIEELMSLVDPSQSSPALPSGHPFSNIGESDYLSATTNMSAVGFAFSVNFFNFNGNLSTNLKTVDLFRCWCVRGGQGFDGMQSF
jgi:hypothetical protein